MDLSKSAKYGWQHKELRRRYVIALDNAGAHGLPCAICGKKITGGERFDLAHLDGGGPRDYAGIACLKCNRGTAGAGASNTANAQRNGNAPPAEPAPTSPVLPTPETHPWLTFHPNNPHLHHTSREW